MNKFICCPKCGYQYLPGEIYDPKHFLGQPKHIIRNSIGEILGYEGITMDTDETYICESCGEKFNISAKITFTLDDKDDTTTIEQPIQKLSLF